MATVAKRCPPRPESATGMMAEALNAAAGGAEAP